MLAGVLTLSDAELLAVFKSLLPRKEVEELMQMDVPSCLAMFRRKLKQEVNARRVNDRRAYIQ